MSKSWFLFGLVVLVVVRTLWKKPLQTDSALKHQMLDWEAEGGRIPGVRPVQQGR